MTISYKLFRFEFIIYANGPITCCHGDKQLCIILDFLTSTMIYMLSVCEEEFEDTKGVIRIRKSMKERQHNGKNKKDKRTNNDLQSIHIKLKNSSNNSLNTKRSLMTDQKENTSRHKMLKE